MNKFNPSEILVIFKQRDVSIIDIFKFTLLDLSLKNVLHIYTIERQAHLKYKPNTYIYVEAGQNFNEYKANKLEKLFLSKFEVEFANVFFRDYFNFMYQQIDSLGSLYDFIVKEGNIKQFFEIEKKWFFLKCLKLSNLGIKVKSDIENELFEIQNILNKNDNENQEIVTKINGNIFFINNVEIDFITRLQQDINNELNQINHRNKVDNHETLNSIVESFRD